MKIRTVLCLVIGILIVRNTTGATTDPIAMYLNNRSIEDGCDLLIFKFDLSGDGKEEVFVSTKDSSIGEGEFVWHVYSPTPSGYREVTKANHNLVIFNPEAAFVRDFNGGPAIISAFSSGRFSTFRVFQMRNNELFETTLKHLSLGKSDAELNSQFEALHKRSAGPRIERTPIRDEGRKYHFFLHMPGVVPRTEADEEEVGPSIAEKNANATTPPPRPQPRTQDTSTSKRSGASSSRTEPAE